MDHPDSLRATNLRRAQVLRVKLATQTDDQDGTGMKGLESLMRFYLPDDPHTIAQRIANHVEYTLARSERNVDTPTLYQATAFHTNDRLIEFWNDTQYHFDTSKVKMCYYMSIEYLLGSSLENALCNLDIEGNYKKVLQDFGVSNLEDLYNQEYDAGLGNGGLGRLAACFLDSMATMDYPVWGYGIRYSYGIFKQEILQCAQIESPDYWIGKNRFPWEVCRREIQYPVRFYGHTYFYTNQDGDLKVSWTGGLEVIAMAYDIPIPGYGTLNTINLRLWSSVPTQSINLESFNKGDYYCALKERQESETITNVLYPHDATPEGRELRLKQEYFFSCASLHDIIDRFKRVFPEKSLEEFSDYNVIQLNDTHPTISIPELMRILLDEEDLSWEEAWKITTKTFAYTNHTVMPEALEKWPVSLFGKLLPRHLEILYEMNRRFLEHHVIPKWPGDHQKTLELSIFEGEGENKNLRMANLAIVGSSFVNGVARIHTEILKNNLFSSFYELWPEKFHNKTNGVTPRRWLRQSNRYLSALYTEYLGSENWVTNLELIKGLRGYVTDPQFRKKFMNAKYEAKMKLRHYILKMSGGKIDVNLFALFDVHVKRIHEYKRQLLNVFSIIYRYMVIKKLSPSDRRAYVVPRVFIFAGKAAPAYVAAKTIIRLICLVAEKVNEDDDVKPYMQVVFMPNYNVSMAQVIIPASDISQHISKAGTEASGTSNMKFAMNGGLILGTLDGANIEIMEEIGRENMFIFGLNAQEVENPKTYEPEPLNEHLYEVLKSVASCEWADQHTTRQYFLPLIEKIWSGNDIYLIARDFGSYLRAQMEVDRTWKNKQQWTTMCINTALGMSKFSSDRTIHQYAIDTWDLKACRVPAQIVSK
eukprot:TRINITY_DN6621_c0_g1_i7.p1 TRINITY_DN6621_c0_g1~~TRINITY_DN6621_c0_g1_i7.p1  ORF type:complete len:873 (-),score=170.97 TRINITY_DN6621_c0_g1_i7:122-2740(-)